MRLYIFFIIFLIGTCQQVSAQTYGRTSGRGIPDATGEHLYDTIRISGLFPSVLDTNFGLEQICLSIAHPYDGDLAVKLIGPDGTTISLFEYIGGGDDSFTNTCLDGFSSIPIGSGTAPFTGTYRSTQPLGNANNGQNPNGIWILDILDSGPADTGRLKDWRITFGNTPARPLIYPSSNLPILLINTFGVSIPNDVKIAGQLKIINNAPGLRNNLTDMPEMITRIGIELRGSSSLSFAQKGFGFSTWDITDNDTNIAILGFPEENDWVMYNPYNDKSFLRNVLTYKLSNDMNQYATRTKFCEVYVNGSYEGIYVFMEKIKRDKNRVDIAKLKDTDNAGDSLTGGYIVKVDRSGGGPDYWTSSYLACGPPVDAQFPNFVYDYPRYDNITSTQAQYIKTYIDSLERALASSYYRDTSYGYRKWLDLPSMIDYTLLNELAKNVDAYRLSTFFHKDRIDNEGAGKIKAGPVWDFNLSMGNADYLEGAVTTGWQWDIGCETNYQPFWWQRLWTDPGYKKDMRCRYTQLRQNILSEAYIDHFIDSNALWLNESKERHFERFPVLGAYVWPNAYYPPTYAEEIDTLKNWLHARLQWMDTRLFDSTCLIVEPIDTATSIANVQQADASLQLFPNPANQQLHVQFSNAANKIITGISIYDIYGKSIFNQNLQSKEAQFQLNLQLQTIAIPAGYYFLRLETENGKYVKSFAVQ